MYDCVMEKKSRNCKRAGKSQLLLLFSFFLFQQYLHIPVVYGEVTKKVYVVYMGVKKHEDPATIKKSHHKMLFTLLGSKEAARNSVLYSYRHGFSGFAARLTETEAEKIAELPGVVQVFPNRIHNLHTTRSWEFIGLDHHSPNSLLAQSNMGKGTIIGVIDSGVWPESESFNDRRMDPVPSHWKGICQKGQNFNLSNCNKKIIGARWFIKGFSDRANKPINTTNNVEFLSPRDGNGHGTHTASTAAGRFVQKASYKGLAAGMARGGAPLAHLAIYKVCWEFDSEGCADADILKAFDKAIQDGVDVLSVSIGNDIPLFSYLDHRNSISIGSFHATAKGIPVICSAGNDGPASQTIQNTAPWLITVAATTLDRTFSTAITLGNHQVLWGQSVDAGEHNYGFTALTYSERIALDPSDDSASGLSSLALFVTFFSFSIFFVVIFHSFSKDCQLGSLNATLAAGKIILCFSKYTQNIFPASQSVFKAGGVGIIFAQPHSDGLTSCKFIPCVKVDYEVGTEILSYIRKARSPVAKLSVPKTVFGRGASPQVASFSSRGPSSISPDVLKPDIAAPGVDILAAFRPGKKGRSKTFVLLSGTSMSCPHVAGIVALIKSVHPDWSPAAIRSALVTTASQTGTDGMEIFEEGPTRKPADPFDIGGGLVNPEKAVHPGLVYDIKTDDYVEFLCSTGYSSSSIITTLTKTTINCTRNTHITLNLNLPSITIPYLKTKVTVTRKVLNVGEVNSVYKAMVQAPFGIRMIVEPTMLSFNLTARILSFKVTFLLASEKVRGSYNFGSLTWTDGEHFVRSPVAIRAVESCVDV